MEVKTYTKRTNARRAGMQAGISPERVVITVHKDGAAVRFGFADSDADPDNASGSMPPANFGSIAAIALDPTGSERQETRNGVKQPKPGGVCRAVWDWLDANPASTARSARAVAADHGWNENNVSCEYYAWRKFHGAANVQTRTASAGRAVSSV